MIEEHTLFKDNLAAYALGTLDVNEAYALEDHLQSCVDCQVELENYQAVSEGLLTALQPQAPSAALKKRLKGRLPQAVGSARKSLSWPFQHISFGQLTLAAAFILLLGLNLFSTLQVRDLQRQQIELTQHLETERSTIALLAYPGTQTMPISGENVDGSLLMNHDTNTAVLLTWNLPELPEGETYQIWLIDSQGNRVNGGLFVPQSEQIYTSTRVLSQDSLSDFVGLGVTIEPWGGSHTPTGPNVLRVKF